MSDATSGGQYAPWREAASQGSLLSFLWANRPSLGQMVPESHPDDPWYQKALDWGSVPARTLVGALRQPVEATDTALHSPALTLDLPAQRGLTQAVLSTGMMASPFSEVPGLPAFPGWHGSRHTFEPEVGEPFGRFREEKIGSGEGAQVYGWGHYIAGEQSTARHYKTAGMRGLPDPITLYDGRPIDVDSIWTKQGLSPVEGYAINQFHRTSGDINKAADQLRKYAAKSEEKANSFDYAEYHRDMFPNTPPEDIARRAANDKAWDLQEAGHMANAADWLESNHHRLEMKGAGNLYQIWIKPEHHEFLDWDKRFDEQSQSVQDIIKQYFPKLAQGVSRWPETQGSELYYNQADYMMPKGSRNKERLASEALDQAGIPGIKFLDQGSRGLPKSIHFEGQPWEPYSDAERIASHAIHYGQTPPYKFNTESLRGNADDAWNLLASDRDFGNFEHAKAALGPNYTAEGYEKATQDAMNWLNANTDKLTMGDHPDATYNYVVFHHRNVSIIDRNGRIFGFTPVEHDPFK